jgi:hypothetical protein
VRGDSLRDLYAKTLALLGLALLAGVGALVDYWPVRLSFPMVQAPRLLPDPIVERVFAREPVELAAVEARPEAVPVKRVRSSELGIGESLLPPAPEPLEIPSDVTQPEIAQPVIVLAHNSLPSSAGLPDAVLEPSEPRAGDAVDLLEAEPPFPMRAAVSGGGGDGDHDGLITGAFKKTGSSIVKTGARTGASIVDAMRVVSGMVRRALPTD